MTTTESVESHNLQVDLAAPRATVSNDGQRVTITGELDLASVDAVREAVVEAGPGAVIDLAGVTFIDSTGLRLILRCTQNAPGAVVIDASPVVRRLFELSGLGHLMEDEAITKGAEGRAFPPAPTTDSGPEAATAAAG